MVTGVTNLNQLLLRWDGSAVQWGSASLGDDGQQVWSYGSREIRKAICFRSSFISTGEI